ncbi:MAG TPA: energy transducer TonB, partial [Methylibium sp.]
MSAATMVSFRTPVLAWSSTPEDEARFRRILARVLSAAVLLCLAMLLLPPPKLDRSQPQELPPRLAKLVLERELAPTPSPVAKEPERSKEQQPQQSEAAKNPEAPKPQAARAEPVPKAARVPEARNPLPDRPPGEVDAARRKAAGVGLLAAADQLAELRGAPVAVQLRQDIKQGPGVGTGVGSGVGAGTDPGVPTRALITSNATGGSGGINTAGYS